MKPRHYLLSQYISELFAEDLVPKEGKNMLDIAAQMMRDLEIIKLESTKRKHGETTNS